MAHQNLAECSICLDVKYEREIYNVGRCRHQFCFKCMETYLQIRIEANEQYPCPYCRGKITGGEAARLMKNIHTPAVEQHKSNMIQAFAIPAPFRITQAGNDELAI